MKDGATKSFEQCYNGQAAVDGKSQIIVAVRLTQQPNDKQQLQPLIDEIKENLGAKPRKLSADSGYYSDNVACLANEQVDGCHIATGRLKHTESSPPAPRGRIPKTAGVKERMARKLRTIRVKTSTANERESSSRSSVRLNTSEVFAGLCSGVLTGYVPNGRSSVLGTTS